MVAKTTKQSKTKKSSVKKTTKPPLKRQKRIQPSKWDYKAAETLFVTDNTMTAEKITKLYGVSMGAVRKRILNDNWTQKRVEYQNELTQMALAKSKAKAIEVLEIQHKDGETLRNLALNIINREWSKVKDSPKKTPNMANLNRATNMLRDSHNMMRKSVGLPDFVTGVDYKGDKQEQAALVQFNINSALDRARSINSRKNNSQITEGEIIDGK